MLALANITDDPSIQAMITEITVWTWLYVIAVFLISCLILWLIIYTAVRAALTSHRRQQADDAAFERGMAAQRRS